MIYNDTDFPNENEDLGIVKEGLDIGDEESDIARLASMHEGELIDEDLLDEGPGYPFE
jgi:hypothetical protein